MKTKRNIMTSSKMILLAVSILITSFLGPASVAAPAKKEVAAKQKDVKQPPNQGKSNSTRRNRPPMR